MAITALCKAITALCKPCAAGSSAAGGTLKPFEFSRKPQEFRDEPFTSVLTIIQAELKKYRDERFEYFNNLRRRESRWANDARRSLPGLAPVLCYWLQPLRQ
jgi:hypothetical protein